MWSIKAFGLMDYSICEYNYGFFINIILLMTYKIQIFVLYVYVEPFSTTSYLKKSYIFFKYIIIFITKCHQVPLIM